MTDSLRQLDLIEQDLLYFKVLEDFYNEHNPQPDPKPMEFGASGMVFHGPKPSVATMKWRLRCVRTGVYEKLDNLIAKQQRIINKLKKKQ